MMIEQLKKQLQGSTALNNAMIWWLGQLKALLPDKLLQRFSPTVETLTVECSDSACRIDHYKNSEVHLLAVCDLLNDSEEKLIDIRQQFLKGMSGQTRVLVRLDDSHVLNHQVVLPLATADNLSSVVEFELDRFTPFRPGQAMVGYQLISRHPEHDKVKVQLVASPNRVAGLINRNLSVLGLSPSAILPPKSITGELNRPQSSSWNMLPETDRPIAQPVWNQLNRRLFIFLLIAFAAVFVIPHFQLEQRKQALVNEIDAIEAEARAVSAKQAKLIQQVDVGANLIERKNTTPSRLAVLDELTRIIEDDTWTSSVEINEKNVKLEGESQQASALIALLEASPMFQNVNFESSTTRNQATNRDRFQIKLDLVTNNGGGNE
ncbi:PilN domain-containing protein [Porticoccaceae bacterium LTM1]|nr:PilN domain-containing protein [Porticoccaceae bacterium LTM1]